MTNAQAAIIAAASLRSGLDDDGNNDMILSLADIFKQWLDNSESCEQTLRKALGDVRDELVQLKMELDRYKSDNEGLLAASNSLHIDVLDLTKG